MSKVKIYNDFKAEMQNPAIPPSKSYQPIIFAVANSEEEAFYELCKNRNVQLIDTIRKQLLDLARVKLPSAGQKEWENFVTNMLEGHQSQTTYGNWVYLPWQDKVVHLLPEDDYFQVITNRNQMKITKEEQKHLRTKTIGVVGLSVGAEAAITIAQEHLCGEIVIADFDELELSNINRLNARFDEIGLPKTVITARRITGINPYLTITVFNEGINEENTDTFLERLDLLLEECDHLSLKFTIRQKAKKLGLNIIYAADECGLLSIEPYAYARDLPVFHGNITQPHPSKESYPSDQEFMKALTDWLGGWDFISERSRQSVLKIGESLCGYPQLASEARFAAGQAGHIARRLLLGQKISPILKQQDLQKIFPSNS